MKAVKSTPAESPITSPALLDKREQILQGAMQVFLSQGYAGTSMDRVAAIAGVSKQTIYSHFQDKEGLFTALIERVTIQRLQRDLGTEGLQGEPRVTLRRLANAYLQKMADEEYLALLRVVMAESTRFPELAQLYTKTVIHKGLSLISTYLKAHPELNLSDPEATARIFIGSLVSFLVTQEILHGKTILPMERDRLVDSLVELVLCPSGR
ncbi:MAG: TetR/AcrR family transcriptional regulator [Oculatellaceae cyanobacterium Prado106]|nr:TetR/AcrR family transcriptional regulator [Oculatellaceae cyanobacterium Prado106]